VPNPFAYESNAPLLEGLFVPHLVQAAVWSSLLKTAPPDQSLLEHLMRSDQCDRVGIMECLMDLTGVDGVTEWTGDNSDIKGAEASLLRANGFAILREGQVCGGPELPPDLHAHLGAASKNWQWCLVSPLRPPSSVPWADATLHPSQAPSLSISPDPGLDSLLWEALSQGARDIHFERRGELLTVRQHDGRGISVVGEWGPPVAERWIRILKQRAGFCLDGQVLPEDGRIDLGHGTSHTSLRLGRVPTVDGESLVLRLTDDGRALPSLHELGVPSALQGIIIDLVANDPGLILFTGVTGSGKTTTASSLLKELAGKGRKIITIEDPVEYVIPGVQQSSVDEPAGWTFASALKAYLRQDPDVLLVGEIRDAESASMACRAALTGHCVLATLHAGHLRDGWDRLLAWQIEPGTLREAVRLMVHQHLDVDPREAILRADFTWTNPYAAASEPLPHLDDPTSTAIPTTDQLGMPEAYCTRD
jgi:Tfp pilus assembly pilus retraction ATPase PilT